MNDTSHAWAIQVRDLRFRYVDEEREILKDISIDIMRGETLLLLGASGSGKSTLAHALTGLIPQRIAGEMGGSVTLMGDNGVPMDSVTTPLATLCTSVGLVMQDPSSQIVMPRVDEEVAFGLENLQVDPAQMAPRIDKALTQTGLETLRHAWIEQLSGGQQQRVVLAALLALSPSILILDEPTASLDPAGAAQFFTTLAAWQRASGATVVIIEHRLDLVLPLVDRVVALNQQGAILSEGDAQSFFTRHAHALIAEGIALPTRVRAQLGLLPARTPSPIDEQMGDDSRPWAFEMAQLRFRYGNGPEVLHGITLQVQQGDFLALVGSNGSGKSTLARHLVGLHAPQAGELHILGQRITQRNARHLPQRVGYVFQNPEHQFVAESVVDEVAYSMRGRWPDTEIARRVDALLKHFKLDAHAQSNPFMLSWGQKRRLSVAGMVALEQQILVLDEPTLGQDAQNITALIAMLRQLNAQGTTIVLITHDMQLVAEVANHAAVLHQGHLLYHGPTDALFDQRALLTTAQLDAPML